MHIVVDKGDDGRPEEWAIIEMQGDLESRVGDAQMADKFIGDLHYLRPEREADKKAVPVLIIGHHILFGKDEPLKKPFLVIEKRVSEVGDEVTSKYEVKAVVRRRLLFKTRPKPIIANVPRKV